MWTFLGTKKKPCWIWLAVSYQTGQVLSFATGRRDEVAAQQMWCQIRASYNRKQVYTDEYKVYENLIPWWRHCVRARRNWLCPKGTGDTNKVEGVNRVLRHRVSYLVRKSLSFARNPLWLWTRLRYVIHQRNLRIARRWTNT